MKASSYQSMVDITNQLTIAQPLCQAQLMVDKNELRAAFSARLHEALNEAGVRARGRGVDVHNRLKSKGVHKTTQAISKWLNGEAIAEADSMVALSDWLNVRREWLEYGVGPKSYGLNEDSFSIKESAPPATSAASELCQKIPLMTWAQASLWCEPGGTSLSESETWIPCPVSVSKAAFALLVESDSMTSPNAGRSYPAGSIIFVDPVERANIGDRVIARIPGGRGLTFKVLAEDAGRTFLRPINPQYPVIDITDNREICGKVVGVFIQD